MTKEALKRALEALENSIDLVREDAYEAEKLYGNYPTRQGKVNGLKVLADDHEKAITAIKEALAQPTTGDYALGYAEGFNDACKKPKQPEQEPVQFKCTVIDDAHPNGIPLEQWAKPQRKPLTDDELSDIWFKQSTDWMEFARAIEAAHGIKENT